MTEKKTFKNPYGLCDFKDEEGKSFLVWPDRICVADEFPTDEWDMEVTFTKKVPDFSPGWFLYSDVPDGYEKEIQWFSVPPPNNGWERVHNRG